MVDEALPPFNERLRLLDAAVPNARPFAAMDPPYWWAEAGRHVLADRHLPNGRRQLIVSGHCVDGLVIANADVFGAADVGWPTFPRGAAQDGGRDA